VELVQVSRQRFRLTAPLAIEYKRVGWRGRTPTKPVPEIVLSDTESPKLSLYTNLNAAVACHPSPPSPPPPPALQRLCGTLLRKPSTLTLWAGAESLSQARFSRSIRNAGAERRLECYSHSAGEITVSLNDGANMSRPRAPTVRSPLMRERLRPWRYPSSCLALSAQR